eukprot:2401136-Alexandrium_andersonii.AAC.1
MDPRREIRPSGQQAVFLAAASAAEVDAAPSGGFGPRRRASRERRSAALALLAGAQSLPCECMRISCNALHLE